jgi:hypothetical protein
MRWITHEMRGRFSDEPSYLDNQTMEGRLLKNQRYFLRRETVWEEIKDLQ